MFDFDFDFFDFISFLLIKGRTRNFKERKIASCLKMFKVAEFYLVVGKVN